MTRDTLTSYTPRAPVAVKHHQWITLGRNDGRKLHYYIIIIVIIIIIIIKIIIIIMFYHCYYHYHY